MRSSNNRCINIVSVAKYVLNDEIFNREQFGGKTKTATRGAWPLYVFCQSNEHIHMHATCMDVAYISLENHTHQLRGYTCMRSAVCLRRVCGGAPLWLQGMSLSHRVSRRIIEPFVVFVVLLVSFFLCVSWAVLSKKSL